MKLKNSILMILILFGGIFLLTGCNSDEKTQEELDAEFQEKKDDFIPMHERIGLSSELSSSFDGIFYANDYDSDEVVPVSVEEIINNREGDIATTGGYFTEYYHFTSDKKFWRELDSNEYVEEVVKLLGKPTTIFENPEYEYFSVDNLIWEFEKYYLVINTMYYYSSDNIKPVSVTVYDKNEGITEIIKGTKYGLDVKKIQ